MSIDKDPEVYKLLVGAVMALLGILNLIGISVLGNIKNSIQTLFGRINSTDKIVTEAVTDIEHLEEAFREHRQDCKENHRRS